MFKYKYNIQYKFRSHAVKFFWRHSLHQNLIEKKHEREQQLAPPAASAVCLFANLVEAWLLTQPSTVEMSKLWKDFIPRRSKLRLEHEIREVPKLGVFFTSATCDLWPYVGLRDLQDTGTVLSQDVTELRDFDFRCMDTVHDRKSWRLGQGRYEKYWENAPSWLCPE